MSVLALVRDIWAPGTSVNKAQRNFQADLTTLSLCSFAMTTAHRLPNLYFHESFKIPIK